MDDLGNEIFAFLDGIATDLGPDAERFVAILEAKPREMATALMLLHTLGMPRPRLIATVRALMDRAEAGTIQARFIEIAPVPCASCGRVFEVSQAAISGAGTPVPEPRQPTTGDFAACRCGAVNVFQADGTLRIATEDETRGHPSIALARKVISTVKREREKLS